MDRKVCSGNTCLKPDAECTRFARKRKYSVAMWSDATYLRRKRFGIYYFPYTPGKLVPAPSPTVSLNDGNSQVKQDDEQTSTTDQEIPQPNCDNENLDVAK